MYSTAKLLRADYQQLTVDSTVEVINEDGLTIVAALDVMRWNTGDYAAWNTSHV
ncbi:hypothetical protein [Gemmatimonas sp.]|uniref:hypothetical protein n=1 Tax=Gemmatimonas sp. TaxID=1962908 RepID=UPI00391F5D41